MEEGGPRRGEKGRRKRKGGVYSFAGLLKKEIQL
jgi:hypothetical protein